MNWSSVLQTIIDSAIDEWHGRLRTCVRTKGRHLEQLLWQYSATWRDVSVFAKCDFIDCFIWKLPQIRTYNSRKVVGQHTEGMVVSIIWVLLEIYFSFQQWKNVENPLRIDKVIAMSLVYYFSGTQCMCISIRMSNSISLAICKICIGCAYHLRRYDTSPIAAIDRALKQFVVTYRCTWKTVWT